MKILRTKRHAVSGKPLSAELTARRLSIPAKTVSNIKEKASFAYATRPDARPNAKGRTNFRTNIGRYSTDKNLTAFVTVRTTSKKTIASKAQGSGFKTQ